MRGFFVSILLLLSALTIFGQSIEPERYPAILTPTELNALTKVDASQLEQLQEGSTKLYLISGQPFSGWALQVFAGHDHRYRYTQYQDGALVRQIGFYADGQIDHDFHFKDGSSYGSERMWHKNGQAYLDFYYGQAGQLEGQQYRWYASGQLALEARYVGGVMQYELEYDQAGKPIGQRGMPAFIFRQPD